MTVFSIVLIKRKTKKKNDFNSLLSWLSYNDLVSRCLITKQNLTDYNVI